MQTDERDLLDVLKFELNFLEKGGYGRSPREPWRPQFIFEDSPTCMNYDSKQDPAPCSECVLMHLIPPESRENQIPCRYIPLNESGETLDSLYRHSDQHEIEESVRVWLKTEIARLEESRKDVGREAAAPATPSGGSVKGRPLGHEVGPKCANPACHTAFHWHEGGKFFRFQPDPAAASAFHCEAGTVPIKHFWLCERCCHKFTLVYTEGLGVLVKPTAIALPVTEEPKELASVAVAWQGPH